MNYHWNYGDRVLNLPAAALDAGADATRLQVLLLLADGVTDPAALAEAANLTERTVRDAIAFWESTGILTADDKTEAGSEAAPAAKKKTSAAKEEKAEDPIERKLKLSNQIPHYSVDELNNMIEHRNSLRVLANEAEQILGKMFSKTDFEVLFAMVDYLGLDEEYILLLFEHCARLEIKGTRTIFNYAVGLIDQGITSSDGLEDKLKEIELSHQLEGKIRIMFGMKNRSLTKKELGYIKTWTNFGYGENIIRMAYERTVDATQKPSMAYADAILDRWHAEGLKTPEEIDRYEEKAHRSEKGVDRNLAVGTSSFDTDEFFDAALKRAMNAGAGKKKENEQNG